MEKENIILLIKEKKVRDFKSEVIKLEFVDVAEIIDELNDAEQVLAFRMLPKDIAADCGILQNHISNVLTELSNLGLIVCINPEVKKGRVYRLTEDGEEMLSKLV